MKNTQKYRGFTIEIDTDIDPISPREYDNIGIIYSAHRNYNPDEHTIYELEDKFCVQDNYHQLVKTIQKDKDYICLPIFYYEHGDITIRTSRYNMPFDSGFFGIILADLRSVACKGLSQAGIIEILKKEIISLDKYMNNYYYCYEIKNSLDEVMDSCGNFEEEEDCIEAAHMLIDGLDEEDFVRTELGEFSTKQLYDILSSKQDPMPSYLDDIWDYISEISAKEYLVEKIIQYLTPTEIENHIIIINNKQN